MTWPHGDPQAVARAIVADPRFRGVTSARAPVPSVWDRVWQWVGDRINDVLAAIGHALGSAHGAVQLIGVLLIAAFAAGIVYGIVRLIDASVRRRDRADARRAKGLPLAMALTSTELWERAALARRAHRLREAAGLMFLSAARALDERGQLTYDPARTPGEYRRLVRDPDFETLTRDAVEALFGEAEPAHELIENMQRAYRRFFGRALA